MSISDPAAASDAFPAEVDPDAPDCQCLADINDAFKALRTRIVSVTNEKSGRVRAYIASEPTPDAKRGAPIASYMASFCPFCGLEYADWNTPARKEEEASK